MISIRISIEDCTIVCRFSVPYVLPDFTIDRQNFRELQEHKLSFIGTYQCFR
jgi:hypothetical protein